MNPPAHPYRTRANGAALRGLVVLLVLSAGAMVFRMIVGSGGLSRPAWPHDEVVMWLRASRVAQGSIVGACLAVGGLVLQALLRNPLASPDLLGVSSGASLAVTISMLVASAAGIETGYSVAAWHGVPALIGAIGAIGLVYMLTQRRGFVDPPTLVLVGVAISFMCGAGIMFVQHLMPDRGLASARLLVGAISDDIDARTLLLSASVAVAGLVVAGAIAPAVDALTLTPDESISVGVNVHRVRLILLGVAGVLTADAVVLAGPIAFVGLVAPHLARRICGLGGGARTLVIGSVLAGTALVVGADAMIKVVPLSSGRLPIGVIMTVIGGATLVALVRSQADRD